jgi:hypothetical protein
MLEGAPVWRGSEVGYYLDLGEWCVQGRGWLVGGAPTNLDAQWTRYCPGMYSQCLTHSRWT